MQKQDKQYSIQEDIFNYLMLKKQVNLNNSDNIKLIIISKFKKLWL